MYGFERRQSNFPVIIFWSGRAPFTQPAMLFRRRTCVGAVVVPLQAALYKAGPDTFARSVIGDEGEAGLANWWAAVREEPWYRDHPGLQNRDGSFHQVAPG